MLGKGEIGFVKDNMTRDDDSIGDRIKTAVSLMVSRIAKEDAESRTGCKFMGSSGRKIGVTLTTENPKMIVGRRTAKEGKMRGRETKGLGGQDVEEKSCSVQRLGPIRRRHARLKQKGADDIVSGTNDPFGFTVLRRRVGTRHAKEDAMCQEEGARAGVVKLPAVVGLDGLDAGAELGRDIGKKVR